LIEDLNTVAHKHEFGLNDFLDFNPDFFIEYDKTSINFIDSSTINKIDTIQFDESHLIICLNKIDENRLICYSIRRFTILLIDIKTKTVKDIINGIFNVRDIHKLNDEEILVQSMNSFKIINIAGHINYEKIKYLQVGDYWDRYSFNKYFYVHSNLIARCTINSVSIWCLISNTCIREFNNDNYSLCDATLFTSPIIILCDEIGAIYFLNYITNKVLKTISVHEGRINSIIRVGNSLVSSSKDGKVKITKKDNIKILSYDECADKLLNLDLKIFIWDIKKLNALAVYTIDKYPLKILKLKKNTILYTDEASIHILDYITGKTRTLLILDYRVDAIKRISNRKILFNDLDGFLKSYDLSINKIDQYGSVIGYCVD
jgi:hypothetical protein